MRALRLGNKANILLLLHRNFKTEQGGSLYAKHNSNMQNVIQLGQVQPSVLSKVERIVKNFETWWNSISVTFTRLCATDEGEVFTHGEVVKAHLYAAVVILIGIGGAL